MSTFLKTFLRGALGSVAVLALAVSAAEAKCARLAFSVNDYGKDGPTKDAKNLLDKHIAQWTAARGISKYTTGKKDVTCELFLDFGVFDEHTCKASATVCWAGEASATPLKAKADLPADEAKAVGPKKTAASAKKAAPAKKAVTPVKAAPGPAVDGAGNKPLAPAKPIAPKSAPSDVAPTAPAPAKTKPNPA